jgi:hypothetical protein
VISAACGLALADLLARRLIMGGDREAASGDQSALALNDNGSPSAPRATEHLTLP